MKALFLELKMTSLTQTNSLNYVQMKIDSDLKITY